MILTSLSSLPQYFALIPRLKLIHAFLTTTSLQLIDSNINIIEDEVFGIYSPVGTQVESVKLEAHRKHIDLHFILEGTELFGYKDLSQAVNPIGEFDEEKDVILFNDIHYSTIELKKHDIIIAQPFDAHAPCLETIKLKKIIFKIKL